MTSLAFANALNEQLAAVAETIAEKKADAAYVSRRREDKASALKDLNEARIARRIACLAVIEQENTADPGSEKERT